MPDLYDFIGGLEGFSPKAYWDNKQWSIGYGTKANGPNEVIDQAEGRRRLESEVNKARGFVDESFPNLESPRRDALTSFTYNVGPGWMTGPTRMAAAVRSGDWDTAAKVMQEYNRGNGQVLPGLLDRRRRESALMLGSPLDQSAPSAPPSPGRSPMADPYTPSPDEMVTPEDVAYRRKYGSMLLEQALSGGNPRTGWGAIGNLALGLSGGLYSDSARKAELAGQMASSRALQDALRSGNAQEALARGLATPYGRQMLGPIAEKVIAGNIHDQSPLAQTELAARREALAQSQAMNPLAQERAKAELDILKRKDALDEWINGMFRPEGAVQPPATTPAQPPTLPGVGSTPTPGMTVAPPVLQKTGAEGDVMPGGITLAQNAPPAAAKPPAAPSPKPQNLRDLIMSLPEADRQMWAMTYKADPKKAMEMLRERLAPMSTPMKHDIDKAELGFSNMKAAFNEIQRQFDPKYLKGGEKVRYAINDLRDKWTPDTWKKMQLNPQEAGDLRNFHQFVVTSMNNLNTRLKELSGTAVTETEMQRILRELPAPGTGPLSGDGPIAFKAKLDQGQRLVNMSIARMRYLRNNGFQGDIAAASTALPLDDVPKLIDRRGAEILQKMREANPGATDEQLMPEALKATKQEFGI